MMIQEGRWRKHTFHKFFFLQRGYLLQEHWLTTYNSIPVIRYSDSYFIIQQNKTGYCVRVTSSLLPRCNLHRPICILITKYHTACCFGSIRLSEMLGYVNALARVLDGLGFGFRVGDWVMLSLGCRLANGKDVVLKTWSILGPLLFILFTKGLEEVANAQEMQFHCNEIQVITKQLR